MALSKKNIFIPLGTGIDAGGTDPLVVEGKVTKADNEHYPRDGVSAKRYGTRLKGMANSATGDEPKGIGSVNGSPVGFYSRLRPQVYDGSAISSGSFNSLSDRPQLTFCDIDIDVLMPPDRDKEIVWCECAVNDNYIGVVYVYHNGSNNVTAAKLFRRNSLTYTGASLELNNTVGGRITTTANGAIVFVYSTGTNCKYYETTTSSWGTQRTVNPGNSIASNLISVCPLDGDKIAVAHDSSSGFMNSFVIDTGTHALSGSAYHATAYSACIYLGMFPWGNGTNNYAVSWANNSTIYAVVLDNTAAQAYGNPVSQSMSNITHISGWAYGDSQEAKLVVGTRASNSRPIISNLSLTESMGSLTLGAASEYMRGCPLVTYPMKAPNVDDEAHMVLYHQGGGWWKSSVSAIDKATAQRTYFVGTSHDSSTFSRRKIIGQCLQGFGGHNLASEPSPSSSIYNSLVNIANVASLGSGKYLVALLKYMGPKRNSLCLATVDLDPDQVEVNDISDGALVTNSIPLMFDGARVSEQAILEYPEGITVASAGSFGTWSSTGNVSFKVVYELYNGKGRRLQSIPSPTVTYTLGATTEQPQLTIPTLQLFYDYDLHYTIGVYATDVDGTVFYRRETITGGATVSTVTSTAFASEGTTTATSGDDIVPVVDVLYTTNGSLEVSPPPPQTCATIYQGRVFSGNADDRSGRINYSREIRDGLGIPYSDFLTIQVSESGGDITGLHEMDSKLFIFKERAIYAIQGNGPDDTGSRGFFARPRLVASSIGCDNSKTICETPGGLMFSSGNGIYMLDRNEQEKFIGHDVRYYTDTYTVTSSTVFQSQNIAVFATTGPALIYNYLYNRWSTWSGYFSNLKDVRAVGSNLWLMLDDDTNNFAVMDTSIYYDHASNNPYNRTIETGWISLPSPLNESRIYRAVILGHNVTASKIKVQYQYNYDPHWRPTTAIEKEMDPSNAIGVEHISYADHLGDGLSSSYIDQAMLIQVKGPKQRCSSVRFRIQDADPTTGNVGQGFEVIGIALVVGVRRQAALIGDTRKAS